MRAHGLHSIYIYDDIGSHYHKYIPGTEHDIPDTHVYIWQLVVFQNISLIVIGKSLLVRKNGYTLVVSDSITGDHS